MKNMTTGRKFSLLCVTMLLATPLSGEVFAQSEQVLLENSNASTTLATSTLEIASSTEAVLPVDSSTDKELWYRSEHISGKIEVGDFVVGPGRAEIEVSPGETVIQEITVTNRISSDRAFMLEVEDIKGSRDASTAVSLVGDERSPYSIIDYITFPESTVYLDLGERARIPITITVPPDAEPGGYYGSVLVSTVQVNGEGTASAPRSPIIARVGSLFFLRVKGETEVNSKTLSVSTLNGKWWYEKGPITLSILSENNGSVHVNPYGTLSITNMFGEEVGYVELDPWFVLPNSLRSREVDWDREFLLGRYKVTAKINRGYDNIVDEVTTTFWVMPWKIMAGIFFILFVIIFSVRAFFRTFEFKRKGD